ncbi:MAG: transcription-repair coupling factor [bacterium]
MLRLHSAPGCLRAFLADFLQEAGYRVLWIIPNSVNREDAHSDLLQILPENRVGLFLSAETRGDYSPVETRVFRIRALQDWTASRPMVLISDPISIWRSILPQPEQLHRIKIDLIPGSDIGRDRLIEQLAQAQYVRTAMAENRGEFALRGGILDIFPLTHDLPLRLEFWGERLESLRVYDPATQRTVEKKDRESLFLSEASLENNASIVSYGSSSLVILAEEPEDIRHQAEETGNADKWDGFLQENNAILWGTPRANLPELELNALPQEEFGGKIEHLTQSLNKHISNRTSVFIACDNKGQLERLRGLIEDRDVNPLPQFLVARLSGGFYLPRGALALFTDHQIFRRPRHRRTFFRFRNFSPVERPAMLRQGDYVVHEDYGIGRFVGLTTIKVGGHARECLQIVYRDNVTLYVRVESLKKVQKYSGKEGFAPPLTRIGRGEWEKIRKHVKTAVKEMANELIKLYAVRQSAEGYAFPEDNIQQQELEIEFPFEETPDQLQAIEAVKRDMETEKPMDRLVCGDVGFGKTEVAIRAAFKAILGGRQVALLVPTTLLAQQHYETFRLRLRETAVELEMLSRFRTSSQQKNIIKRLRDGHIDIIIGTHRLLSNDVVFQNLGLLIVDEEHRFGVKHKEKLKKLRAAVDVLTLTATPIPRTMHMALAGIRDMSLIKTPPQDRLPIETEIATFSQELITAAVLREIDRGGQIYFVHNRIHSIASMKRLLERWLPEVRFVVAHGQMPERQLEKTMTDFLAGKYDCLISTMIIESGLDLPNVNTMIVNRADQFGLAQLYQLRGRIGRSNRQAYAYLLIPPKLALSDPARRRLNAIRDCSYLGAGFQIAMHDLEIRGAGEIFGARQSGFIHSVGFELYQRILDETVKEIRLDHQAQPDKDTANHNKSEPKIEFPLDAYIPNDYIEHPEQRVEIYRRLSRIHDKRSLLSLLEEVADRFGAPPETVRRLFDLIELKLTCQTADLAKLELRDNFMLAELNTAELQNWRRRLQRLMADPPDSPFEFINENPLKVLIRWNENDDWESKILKAKNFLDKMSLANS